ncbi:MAG TPA: response regulator transcription factor [Gemmatimonadaceae bacterium]|jgi:two-component system nitrate/nitrite response regulator NarL|nr:response regulator transcription factor [Gemmatimonadaceae bacterium]
MPAVPASQRTIAVAIVDDNRLMRDALAALLRRIADFHVEATHAADDVFMEAVKPDVLLLDVGLADDDSLQVATVLSSRFPGTRIVMMELIPMHEDIVQFVNGGVSGFVLKDATFDELVATIRSVVAGDKVLPPRMTESLFSQIVQAAGTIARAETLEDVRLTRREREVIELIGEGLSNKEIAQRLDIASHTVKSHVRNVMEKLALHTRLQIAAYVRRDGAP